MLARRFALDLVPGQTIEIEPQVNLRTREPIHMHVIAAPLDGDSSPSSPRHDRLRHPDRAPSTHSPPARAASTTSPARRASGSVPYAELRVRALGLLHHLQSAGARAGTHVVILLDGLAPFVDTFWACVLGRIMAVPLAPGNADEHKAKFFRVLGRLSSPVLATERKVFDRLRTYAQENGLDERFAHLEQHTVFLDEIADVSVPGIEHAATPDDVAFIQFSSGSTSEPKGVILTHRNLVTNIDAIARGIARPRGRHEPLVDAAHARHGSHRLPPDAALPGRRSLADADRALRAPSGPVDGQDRRASRSA